MAGITKSNRASDRLVEDKSNPISPRHRRLRLPITTAPDKPEETTLDKLITAHDLNVSWLWESSTFQLGQNLILEEMSPRSYKSRRNKRGQTDPALRGP